MKTPLLTSALCLLLSSLVTTAESADGPDYSRDIAPLLQKHCAACHNADDREGGLSVESFADLQQGGERGPAIQPGEIASSRLLLLVTGKAEPIMPPEGNEPLSKAELASLTEWIKAGAKGPDGMETPRRTLIVPKLPAPTGLPKPISSVAVSPDGKMLAVARFAVVELRHADSLALIRRLEGFPGKVNAVEFSADGSRLIAASGISGLYGEASIWDIASGTEQKAIEGHRDTLYDATLSPNGRVLATTSYDRRIELWNPQTGEPLRTLTGHNGAIFDLAFSPDGTILASASADATIKLWHVATGTRLDTLGQPLKEQYAVRFSPDGRFVVGGGLDNRIRVWQVVSREKPQINPLQFARIAHEGAVIQLAFSPDGSRIVSIADDQTSKLWETAGFTEVTALPSQPDVTQALAMARDGKSFFVGRSDGTLERVSVPETSVAAASDTPYPSTTATPAASTEWTTVTESEPNNAPAQAATVALPAKLNGVIFTAAKDGATASGAEPDVDLYRFSAKAGQRWVFEVKAARDKSPLDSRLEVLDADGHSVPRVLLQAVRDSYITFRGINSQTRDCRVHNWEEMDLNQYLYMNGEVAKLWLWPRGPDSGFQFYPQRGNRVTFFDTTATSHPLQEPCYIVEPHAPGTNLTSNGLPVFTLYYENDDDSKRELGSDSRLHFTAPADGEYLLRVSDVRSFQGEDFKYEVTARPAQPDFTVRVEGGNPSVNAGSGKEFRVIANRKDGFDGEIRVDIDGLPPGFIASTPLLIEAGQDVAYGTLNAAPDAVAPTEENAKTSKLTATATINGEPVTHEAGSLGEIKLADTPKVLVSIGPDTLNGPESDAPPFSADNPLELTIVPGETITARVHIQRNGDFKGRIGFEAISHNLPHGVIVDNIGLNGLLIVEGTTQRQFFLTAAPWVPEQTRLFFLRSKEEGGQTTWPILLHVKKPQ
ncbi:MAG: c-type cytochrome domain-containing protein [Planctomycetota bacterium]